MISRFFFGSKSAQSLPTQQAKEISSEKHPSQTMIKTSSFETSISSVSGPPTSEQLSKSTEHPTKRLSDRSISQQSTKSREKRSKSFVSLPKREPSPPSGTLESPQMFEHSLAGPSQDNPLSTSPLTNRAIHLSDDEDSE